MSKRIVPLASLLLALTLLPAGRADAQSWKDRLKQKAKEKIDRRVDQHVDQGMDAALDKADGAISCAVTDKACQQKAQEDGKSVVLTDRNGKPVGGGNAASPSAGKPGEGAWTNYDFVPGEKTLFAEDFTRDNVGDFPRRLELDEGNMEVAEWQGGRYLRATTSARFQIPLPAVLPERFTVEMDVYNGARSHSWGEAKLYFTPPEKRNEKTPWVEVNWADGGINGQRRFMTDVGQQKFADAFVPLRIMADGKYVKVYMGEQRVANVPNADLGRANAIWIELGAIEDSPALIGNIRVAAGGRDLYDALATKGRVATQGIYFDVGSDRIRPESTPTLKEIADMLEQHADLRLTIEGHTDNTGDAQANQVLSERRAAAVKAYLVNKAGIDESRLASKGFGPSKPAAPNTTAEGRQQNRRVELVKM